MSGTQDTHTGREEEQVSPPVINTTTEISDVESLALAAEFELETEKSATPEQTASESEDAPPEADDETLTTTEQVVEHVVTTEINQDSPSAPQWTPVNPSPRPTTGGKGIKQAGGDYIEPSEAAMSLPTGSYGNKGIQNKVEDDLEHATVGDPTSSEGTEQGNKAPSSAAAARENTTPSSPQDDEQATDHPKTGGKGPTVGAPFKLETLKTESAERMRNHLASAGLDTKGTKDQLMVRILLSDNNLDIPTYALRCSILMDTIWNLRQLKDRCEELGVPEADRKTSSKTKLVQLLLLAEKDQGIVFADSDNLPKTSAWTATKVKESKQTASRTSTPPKTDLKRKHDDSADATDDESPNAKRAKSDGSDSPNGNKDCNSTPRPSTPRPNKAPKKRPAKSKTVSPEDNGASEMGTRSQTEPPTTTSSKPKRKRVGDDETCQDGRNPSKRTKKHDSSILAVAASKKAPTSQVVKQAMNPKKPTKPKVALSMPCNVNNVAFGIQDKVDSSVLFENQPIPGGVADAAFRILSGRSTDGDTTTVHFHRLSLPKYHAYCQKHIDERSGGDDKSWLDTQKFWEVYEMKAVCESIGEEYNDGVFEDEMLYEEPIGMTVRDYYRLLKEPEGDERMTKEEKQDLRDKLMRCAVLGKVSVADPEFRKIRHGREAPWPEFSWIVSVPP